MAEATIGWLRSLAPDEGLAITVASADPIATATRLGCSAVPWVGFAACGDDTERAALMRMASDGTTGSPALLAAVAAADALVVAGGGNLNSMWPDHVHERALAAAVARRAGIPVVVTGQTLGPFDTRPERDAVAELLTTAAVVGVREPHSAEEARALGVEASRLVEAPDDALLLEGVPPQPPAGLLTQVRSARAPGTTDLWPRFIAVTIHPFAPRGHERYAALGRQLGRLAERVGARVVLVPHVRRAEGGGLRDLDVAVEVAAHCDGVIVDAPTAREAAWVSHNAWLVVSSRYHPIVFASAAAVPALALTWGHYTSVKCRGALGHAGVEPWWVDLEAAADGLLLDAAGELARRREEVADWMRDHLAALASRDAWRRWRIARTLGFDVDTEPRLVSAATGNPANAPRPAGGWAATRA